MKTTIESLEQVKMFYKKNVSNIEIPKKDNWKSKSNDELWLTIVAEIVSVGNSKPCEKLQDHKEEISFEKLKKYNDLNKISKNIHKILREIGTRYASEDKTKCKKTKAITQNFNFLKNFPNEIKGFFDHVSKFHDEEIQILYVKDNLKYIANAKARDLLMELGLVRNTITLDIRVVKSLRYFGINIPDITGENYKKIENYILEKICNPLNIEGIQLDRVLYNSYDKI